MGRFFGYNMLMIGPPGAGKTLLARAMPGILPRMSIDEALDVTRIYSVADQLTQGTPLIQIHPFRARVESTRKSQRQHFTSINGSSAEIITCNADMRPAKYANATPWTILAAQ
jgi:energy-coupling factor transporter ATP-binding protein EcfA2